MSLAAYGNPTPSGTRVGPVYTPPEHRGRGYATSLVADITAGRLAAGFAFCFLGTRTANFDATAALFRDVLGLQNTHAEPGWSVLRLPSGRTDLVEVFGPEHNNESIFPNEVRDGVVVAFAVDDIVGAREELAAAGVEQVGEIVWAADAFANPDLEGYGWFFLRAPDGRIYVMQQDSRPVTT